MLRARTGTEPPPTMSPRANGDVSEPTSSTGLTHHDSGDGSLLETTEMCNSDAQALQETFEFPDLPAPAQDYPDKSSNVLRNDQREGSTTSSVDSPLADIMVNGPNKKLVDALISPSEPVLYDPTSGRLRHSCPIIAFHEWSARGASNTTLHYEDKERKVQRVLRELSVETHDHLMEGFWSHYTPVMQVVNRQFFEEDMKAGRSLAYSGFLHICMLAMGYRYADYTRRDIQMLALPNKASTLHREAKYMVEMELEQPGGIPSIQALLILGQLESGSGRDAVGSMYAGSLSNPILLT